MRLLSEILLVSSKFASRIPERMATISTAMHLGTKIRKTPFQRQRLLKTTVINACYSITRDHIMEPVLYSLLCWSQQSNWHNVLPKSQYILHDSLTPYSVKPGSRKHSKSLLWEVRRPRRRVDQDRPPQWYMTILQRGYQGSHHAP